MEDLVSDLVAILNTSDFYPDDLIYKIEDPATEEEHSFCKKMGPLCFRVEGCYDCVTKVWYITSKEQPRPLLSYKFDSLLMR